MAEEKFIYLNGFGFIKCSAIISVKEKWMHHNYYICFISLSNNVILEGSALFDPSRDTINNIRPDNVIEDILKMGKNVIFSWRVVDHIPN